VIDTPTANKDLVFNEGYRPGTPELYIQSAEGCRIRDVDGRSYIDLNLGAGTAILGHAHPDVVAAIRDQATRGSIYIRPNPIAHDFAALLAEVLPKFGGFVFCNSGAEATMRACRIARAFTGKTRIGIFSGGWHGGHDGLLVEEDYGGNAAAPRPYHRSAGIPRELLDLILFLPYNDEHAFELIHRHRNELAMVLIEPSQGSNPRGDVGPFLRRLRSLTREDGVLLGFDEIITGFRLTLGGAQELYGIDADIATYGKVAGGGLSVGIVGGTADVMSCVSEGRNGDGRGVFMGGTFSANPLTMAAGRATLSYLIEHGARIYPLLNACGSRIVTRVNAACADHDVPAHVMGVGSMFRLIFTAGPVGSRRERDALELGRGIQDRVYAAILAQGIHVGSNRINFLSTAHGVAEVDAVADAFVSALVEGRKQGWLRHG
jgi:glutamate-1-semialdehyde 2,1-aminomutase